MSQSQKPQTQVGESGGMNRREFLRRGTAGAVAVGGLAYAKPPVQNAQAFPPALVAAGGIAVGAAAGYLTRSIQDYVTADDFDEGAYDEANDEQVYNAVYESAIQIRSSNNTVLTTINNNISLGQNAAFSEAKKAAIEQLNLGNDASAAEAAAKEANADYWSVPQENFANHFGKQISILESLTKAVSSSGLSESDVFRWADEDDSFADSTWNFEDRDLGLANGEFIKYRTHHFSTSNTSPETSTLRVDTSRNGAISMRSKYDQPRYLFFDGYAFVDTWESITDNKEEVDSNIETWVPAVAEEYESDDLSLDDVISPSDIANNAADSDGFAYAGADLASLGLSTIGGNWDIRLEESDVIVRGTIYLLTDETLATGQTYSPDNIDGPVYLAYEWEDGQFDDEPAGSDLIALEQEFTILGGEAGEWVEDEDGERVYETQTIGEGEEISFSETYQSTTDTDIEAFREELQTLRERNQELEEQQLEATSGGGGGGIDEDSFLFDRYGGVPVWGWLTGGGIAAYLFGGD